MAFARAPVFDIADVHRSNADALKQQGMIPGTGRLEFRGATLVDLIEFAYDVDDDSVIGGTKWMGADWFDVIAKGARGTSDDTVKLMLRALLADRFKLVFHTVDKPTQAYSLTVGKKVLMKQAADNEQPDTQGKGEGAWIAIECRNMTMPQFAQNVHQWAGGYLTHPVADQTGLKGGWDFTLRWTGRGALESTPGGLSVFAAVVEELGLKLELKTALPVPVMAIDSASETPTSNAPGVKENLPVTATEFEVAEIRLSPPGMQQQGDFRPGGGVDIRALSIADFLPFVYDVDQGMMIGAPKWMETDRYDIVAKAPTDVSINALKVMMRSLFVERFQLKTHTEDRPVPAYVMTVGKRGSKLEKAS